MYADRVEAVTRKSIKERINGTADHRRQISGKRHREEDDKWVHDLYKPHELQGSNQRVGTKDLRLKLQRRRSIEQATQIIKSSLSGGTRDLREKLSGTVYSRTVKTDVPKKKLKAIPEVSQPAERSVIAEAPAPETKNVASKVSKQKSRQKASISHLLRLLLQMRSLLLEIVQPVQNFTINAKRMSLRMYLGSIVWLLLHKTSCCY